MERDPMEVADTADILALDIMMRYLNVTDLLICRLLSDLWNRAASLELRERSTMIKTISNENQLMQLKDCMKQSWNFPFAGLKFDRPREFQSDAAMEFFKEYGPRFTRLSLDDLNRKGSLDDLAPFIYLLSRLCVLELGHSHSHATTRLFVQPSRSTAGQEDDVPTLPCLRFIRISTTNPEEFVQVLRQLLQAASPSIQIECLNDPTGMLRVLKNAGKLRALSAMKFDMETDFRKCQSEIDELLATESPSLTKLDVHRDGLLSNYGLKKILFASQGTLKALHLSGICLSQLPLYKRLAFSKLTTLSFDIEVVRDREYLFSGRNEANFPALRHLKLKLIHRKSYVRVVFVDNCVFPTVTSLDLDGHVEDDGMKKLAQMFPNVAELELDAQYYSGPFVMWTVREFKCLEKLWSSGTLLLDNQPPGT